MEKIHFITSLNPFYNMEALQTINKQHKLLLDLISLNPFYNMEALQTSYDCDVSAKGRFGLNPFYNMEALQTPGFLTTYNIIHYKPDFQHVLLRLYKWENVVPASFCNPNNINHITFAARCPVLGCFRHAAHAVT